MITNYFIDNDNKNLNVFDEISNENIKLKKKIKELEWDINVLNGSKIKLIPLISDYKIKLAKQENKIYELEQKVERKNELIASYEDELKSCEDKIEDYKNELSKYEDKVEERDKMIDNLDNGIKKQREQLLAINKDISLMRIMINKNAMYNDL